MKKSKIFKRKFESKDGFEMVVFNNGVKQLIYPIPKGVDGKLALPDGVTDIESDCISHLDGITAIRIPQSVRNIAYNNFSPCEDLESIVVDDANPFFDSRENCNAIIDTASKTLLVGCKSSFIPDGVEAIACRAFYHSKIESIYIPASVHYIDRGAFHYSCLKSIKVDKGNPYYDSREDCNAIIETATNELVVGCKGTVIPSNVEKIGDSAFVNDFDDDKSLIIPDGVKSLDSYAFQCLRHLSSIHIPASVVEIGEKAFRSVELKSIEVDPANPKFDSRKHCNALIETDTGTLLLGCLNTKIPSGIKIIGESAFEDCRGLSSVEIPNGVVEIRDNAFTDCDGLRKVLLPISLTHIGSGAFSCCTNLSQINIPRSVVSIGEGAFEECLSITGEIILESVKKIEKDAFAKTYIEKLRLGSGVRIVEERAFIVCDFLKKIVISEGVELIDVGAFDNCPRLETIVLPKSIKDIERTFLFCSHVSKVYIPKGMKDYYLQFDSMKAFRSKMIEYDCDLDEIL